MPMGIFSAISVAACSSLLNKIHVKYILLFGVLFSITGVHFLSTLTLSASQHDFLIANAIMGSGKGILHGTFVSLCAIKYTAKPTH